jgi:hypothetical protein
MAELVLNGPAIPRDTHNVVLRDALIHSPVARGISRTDYYKVDVGVREGEFTTWIGTWREDEQPLASATPLCILDDDRRSMRLREKQSIVVRITPEGTPASLVGTRVNFRLGRVGRKDGANKALVSGGASVRDANTRTALSTMERQINTVLSEWEDGVQLRDPVPLVSVGTFQGRLQVDSTTVITLQPYVGDWIEVNGAAVSITNDAPTIDGFEVDASADTLLAATGEIGTTSLSSDTLYYVYVHATLGLRCSTTSPTAVNGVKYLNDTDSGPDWRFCGWVRTNGSTQFVDDSTNRHLVNYYNRRVKHIILTPAYADGNSETTFTETGTSYSAANSGTGSTGSYIANGEDAVRAQVSGRMVNSGANDTCLGIGDNSTTAAAAAIEHTGTSEAPASTQYASIPSEGYRTISMLTAVSGGTGTYTADFARRGSAADPIGTVLIAEIMA